MKARDTQLSWCLKCGLVWPAQETPQCSHNAPLSPCSSWSPPPGFGFFDYLATTIAVLLVAIPFLFFLGVIVVLIAWMDSL